MLVMSFNMLYKNSDLGNIINQADIDNFEKKYNLSLPSDYKSFLLDTNGGKLDDNIYFEFNNNISDGVSSIYFEHLNSICFWIDDIISNQDDDIGYRLLHNNIIRIGYSGSNGLNIGIIAEKDKKSIVIIDYEFITEDPFLKIANNFTEFINALKHE